MTEIGSFRLGRRIIVNVDDAIQVSDGDLDDAAEGRIIEGFVVHIRGERKGGQVTDGGLIGCGLFHDLRAVSCEDTIEHGGMIVRLIDTIGVIHPSCVHDGLYRHELFRISLGFSSYDLKAITG